MIFYNDLCFIPYLHEVEGKYGEYSYKCTSPNQDETSNEEKYG